MTCDPGGTSRALEKSDPNLPTTKPPGETCDPPSAAGRDVETTRNGRSIRSLGAPVATFFYVFFSHSTWHPWNEKSGCLTKGDFEMLEDMCWIFVIHVDSMKSLHLFWNRNVICDGSGCTTFAIRFYWHIAFLTLPPSHPPFESKMFELCFGPRMPKDLLGFRYDSSFQLALPHHFAMRILEDEDASCPRSVGLDRFQGENQGVVVICIRLEGILDVLRLEIGWNECLDSWMLILTWEKTTVRYTMFFHGHRVIYFTATYHSYSRNGISCGFCWFFTYSLGFPMTQGIPKNLIV